GLMLFVKPKRKGRPKGKPKVVAPEKRRPLAEIVDDTVEVSKPPTASRATYRARVNWGIKQLKTAETNRPPPGYPAKRKEEVEAILKCLCKAKDVMAFEFHGDGLRAELEAEIGRYKSEYANLKVPRGGPRKDGTAEACVRVAYTLLVLDLRKKATLS